MKKTDRIALEMMQWFDDRIQAEEAQREADADDQDREDD